MAIHYTELGSKPDMTSMILPKTEHIESAAVHLLGFSTNLSNETAQAAEQVVVNFYTRLPEDEAVRHVYRNARYAFPLLSDHIADDDKALELSLKQEGNIGEFVWSISAYNDTPIVTEILRNSSVDNPEDVPDHEVENIVLIRDQFTSDLTLDNIQITANEQQLVSTGSTIFEDRPIPKTAEDVAQEIYTKIMQSGVKDEVTLDSLHKILPSVTRELQRIGNNKRKSRTYVTRDLIIQALIRTKGKNMDQQAIRDAFDALDQKGINK